jgi:hypothetical protein
MNIYIYIYIYIYIKNSPSIENPNPRSLSQKLKISPLHQHFSFFLGTSSPAFTVLCLTFTLRNSRHFRIVHGLRSRSTVRSRLPQDPNHKVISPFFSHPFLYAIRDELTEVLNFFFSSNLCVWLLSKFPKRNGKF